MGAKIIGNVMPVLEATLNGGERMGVPPLGAAAPEPAPADHEPGPDQALPPPPWYRRRGILIAAAFTALIAEVGITVSGPGDPGTAPGGTATSTPWSASFSLIATGFWTTDATASPAAEPPPAEPPAAESPAAEPPAAAPPPVAPRTAPPHPAAPPTAAPPPPPPSELVIRHDDPLTANFVSITNNANKPTVGCVFRAVAVAGPAAAVHYDHSVNFTVTGSGETRIPAGHSVGPATGSTFHDTVTCDNGLSTSQDVIY